MLLKSAILASLVGLAAAVLAPAAPATATSTPQAKGGDGGDDVPACIDYWGEARYAGLGYKHIVHVKSECEKLAHCKVWTNVNTDKQRVDVPAGEEKQVVTYIGSPASEFEAHAECKLEQ